MNTSKSPLFKLAVGYVGLVVLVVVGVLVFNLAQSGINQEKTKSAEKVIFNSEADISNENAEIGEIVENDGWRLVVVRSTNANDYGNVALAFVKGEEVVLGPSTGFSDEELTSAGVPSSLMDQYRKGQIPQQNELNPPDFEADNPQNRYPILGYLPNNDSSRYFYSVEPQFRNDADYDSFYILITADEDYRMTAIDKISSIGFDPGDYEIEIEDFVNPFTGGKI